MPNRRFRLGFRGEGEALAYLLGQGYHVLAADL